MAMIESKHRATSDPRARKRVLEGDQRTRSVEYVLFWFTDLEGHLKSFAITPAEIEAALDDGMGFDGSSITGFNAIEESDMVAIPDPETFRLMPNGGRAPVGRMICDIVKPDGSPYEGDPRYVLRQALERMQSMGFDTFNVGPELEYFLFQDDKGTETLDEGGYFAMTTMDAATELRNDTIKALESMGIPIEYHHHEVAPSQHEIDMRYARRARHGRPHDHLPADREGGRAKKAATTRRSCRSRSSARTARACTRTCRSSPTGAEPVLRRRRRAPPLRDGEGVHRRPAPPRARALGGVRAVGQLVQAARAGLRGAGLRRLVAAEPLGADPDPALQAGLRAGDAGRDPLPRPGLQPVPHLRGAAARGPRGDREGLRRSRSRWTRTSTT